MEEKRFNLLREAWIPVMLPTNEIREVSVEDALIHAQEYREIAGEVPTLNPTLVRFLLAFVLAVFWYHDENGNEAQIQSEDDAYDRWQAIWTAGQFPQKPITDYLNKWEDRFWLFHPECPFWQMAQPEASQKTQTAKAAKLNGAIMESANKPRLFAERKGVSKEQLNFSEAARWLIYLNNYPDNALKTSEGVGLAGYGIICAQGENLFETLMLNAVFLKDGEALWDSCKPDWEQKPAAMTQQMTAATDDDKKEMPKKPMPPDFAAVLTIRARRNVRLYANEDCVLEAKSLKGTYLHEINFNEQMALWEKDDDDFVPKRNPSGRQMWRGFSSLLEQNGTNAHSPGIIQWHRCLVEQGILPKNRIIGYDCYYVDFSDKKNMAVGNILHDSLSFYTQILSEIRPFRKTVLDAVSLCDQYADRIDRLARDIALAEGAEKSSDSAKEQYYYLMDMPFRRWLRSLKPDDSEDEREQKKKKWQETAYSTAEALGKQLVDEAGPIAFAGKNVKIKEKNVWYSSPKAYNRFLKNINDIT